MCCDYGTTFRYQIQRFYDPHQTLRKDTWNLQVCQPLIYIIDIIILKIWLQQVFLHLQCLVWSLPFLFHPLFFGQRRNTPWLEIGELRSIPFSASVSCFFRPLSYSELVQLGVIYLLQSDCKADVFFALPETNIAMKMVVSNRNLLFQGSIFRGYVGFRDGI